MEIFARRIGSALDPTLRLFSASGREIAYSDDLPGLSEDAQIDYTFAKAGDYVLAVEDNMNQGGGNYPYHLRIGDFPGAVVATPLGATRGSDVIFNFGDKAGSKIEPLQVKVPTDPLLVALNVPARFPAGSTRSFATVLLSDRKEVERDRAERRPQNGHADRIWHGRQRPAAKAGGRRPLRVPRQGRPDRAVLRRLAAPRLAGRRRPAIDQGRRQPDSPTPKAPPPTRRH